QPDDERVSCCLPGLSLVRRPLAPAAFPSASLFRSLGTLNFIDDDKRRAAAQLVRSGRTVSLSLPFDMDGPQKGWRRRTNPVHTMLDTGTDVKMGRQGFPSRLCGAGDNITMPLTFLCQCV